jgi:hypothetical protein
MVNITALVQENEVFLMHGKVELFPQKGGWHFVRVPKKYTEITHDLSQRGLVAITATLGSSTWKTSLLPMGDGTQFIALSAKVRKAEKIKLDDAITMSFVLREP